MAFIKPRHSDIEAFQNEMEYAFMLDANPEDIKEFSEAKKCMCEILKSRRKVNKIIKLTQGVLHND